MRVADPEPTRGVPTPGPSRKERDRDDGHPLCSAMLHTANPPKVMTVPLPHADERREALQSVPSRGSPATPAMG